MPILKAKIIFRGFSPSDYNRYEAVFDKEPNSEEITEAQVKLGYDPRGYGGPFNIRQSKEKTHYIVQWSSFASCD